MHYCPKCGAGIFNSNLSSCPMCNADLEAELAVESYLKKEVRPTLWAKILCVILSIDAIWIMVEGYFTLMLESKDFYAKYDSLLARDIESMENFLAFGAFIIGVFTALGVYGLITYKRIGPRFVLITHILYVTTYLMYVVNMTPAEIYNEIGGIHIKIPIHIAVHTLLLIINYKYFQKRRNVYDGVL